MTDEFCALVSKNGTLRVTPIFSPAFRAFSWAATGRPPLLRQVVTARVLRWREGRVLLRRVAVIDPSDLPLSDSSPAVPGAMAADAAGAHAADSSHHGPFHSHCENCHTPLAGPFCHLCGQHDFEFHRSFRHVFHDALENFFHFDAKLFRNVVTLLFQPGRLTAAFNAGKRASQVPPFRLYVFVAFMFFALIFWGADEQTSAIIDLGAASRGESAETSVPEEAKSLADEIRNRAESARPQRIRELENKPGSEFGQLMETRGNRALDPAFQKAMGHAFIIALPKILFFCLPFFALYTRGLFRKSGTVYLQHLVVALHFHTFIFLWVLWRDGWSELIGFVGHAPQRWFNLACNLWMIIYPVLMLRHLFRNSWTRTIFKTGVLGLAYVITLGLVFLLTAVILFFAL